MKHGFLLRVIFLLLFSANAMGQICPPNIGFEDGNFDNWKCLSGTVERTGALQLDTTGSIAGTHTLLALRQNTPPEYDIYGKFPVNCPNGSGYTLKLGNNMGGAHAEGVNYTFTIPANRNNYSLLYNYAVVFQNPPHAPEEQPRFMTKVFNVTDGAYVECGSFKFIAGGDLSGFELSDTGKDVFFKRWSPVTVDLSGLAGKTVRLEFYTNDCAYTEHFGYAYVDVNEDCSSSPIKGNTYCGAAQFVTLTAPFGFAEYQWYNSDFSQALGNSNILTLSPAPPPNTVYALVVTPYTGLGCPDTLYSTIQFSGEPFQLNVLNEIKGCPSGVDLTSPSVTAGSSPFLTYSYFTNINQTEYVPIPRSVTESGTYYIMGVNKAGCHDIKPVTVTILEPPNVTITDPGGVCVPQKIDITVPSISAGSDPGLVYTYWKNPDASVPLSNANAIDTRGTYYIKGTKPGGCSTVKPVEVKIGEVPTVIINDPTGCAKVDLTDKKITAGSTTDVSYSYWTDAAGTNRITDVRNITASGTYYIRVSTDLGCTITRPVVVTVNPIPDFIVTDPKPVSFPVISIDLTSAVNQNTGLAYTYWTDALTTKPVINPMAVEKRGRYFIKGTDQSGCSAVRPVDAVIVPPPYPVVYVPNAFTPNNDGLNDIFKIKVIGETIITHLRIYNRWGEIVYDDTNLTHTWDGKLKGKDLPPGTYIWVLNGMDTYYKRSFTQKGSVTLIR